jgi:hypothetical protein
MDETYRMLGREREADLARSARRVRVGLPAPAEPARGARHRLRSALAHLRGRPEPASVEVT